MNWLKKTVEMIEMVEMIEKQVEMIENRLRWLKWLNWLKKTVEMIEMVEMIEKQVEMIENPVEMIEMIEVADLIEIGWRSDQLIVEIFLNSPLLKPSRQSQHTKEQEELIIWPWSTDKNTDVNWFFLTTQ